MAGNRWKTFFFSLQELDESNFNSHYSVQIFMPLHPLEGVHQGCILSHCFFNLNAVYRMQNARMNEAQVGIKIARRNINNLRSADDTTLMAESEEELNAS